MKDEPVVMSVPEAGRRFFGLGRDASYAAAARGEIPVMRFGRLLKVPVAAARQQAETGQQPKAKSK